MKKEKNIKRWVESERGRDSERETGRAKERGRERKRSGLVERDKGKSKVVV